MVLSIDDLDVTLGSNPVLRGIDLAVAAGEVVALLGPNGSGKSTLVKTVTGLVAPDRGRVRVFGADLAGPHRQVPWQRLGYVPQRTGATTGVPATALEVVASGLLHRRSLRPGRGARRRCLDALAEVGLADRAGDSVQVLSGGQQQRVLIARALVREPDLLVLDEPLSGMDRASMEALAGTLERLRERGATVLVVLHDLGPLERLITRTVVLEGGRVVHDGPVVPGPEEHPDAHPHPETPGRPPTAPDLERNW
ncbi:metal ABC transporter ATP-binding protein [Kocuria flava]|uniref:metal ABC transporter ATP-binding protein n=1 Tax=Kocuria flava TaxID=446860 RepID=UPI001FF32FD6|nr:metal ABC transporter ATP-binding protein [Kocuria flava]MCJ8505961.1 metal ABC transporter ATP-binding protein [Kocuria flava]